MEAGLQNGIFISYTEWKKLKKFYNDFGVQKVITYFAVGLNKLIFQHDGLLKMNTLLNIYHFKLSTNQKGSMSIAVDVWLESVWDCIGVLGII